MVRSRPITPPLAAFALLLALLGLAGCSGKPAVSGTVSYKGEPVDDGGISFVPVGGGAAAGAAIADGPYTVEPARGPAPGQYKVEIYWNKKTGKTVPTPGDQDVKKPETKQAIPPKYNTQTQLTADIKPGRNVLDFNLAP
jgi:hypothetical protein